MIECERGVKDGGEAGRREGLVWLSCSKRCKKIDQKIKISKEFLQFTVEKLLLPSWRFIKYAITNTSADYSLVQALPAKSFDNEN